MNIRQSSEALPFGAKRDASHHLRQSTAAHVMSTHHFGPTSFAITRGGDNDSGSVAEVASSTETTRIL
jgi:hypothetical protein